MQHMDGRDSRGSFEAETADDISAAVDGLLQKEPWTEFVSLLLPESVAKSISDYQI